MGSPLTKSIGIPRCAGQLQIVTSFVDPFWGLLLLFVMQMPKGNLGPGEGMPTAVEVEQLKWRVIVGQVAIRGERLIAHPGCAQPFAFQGQKAEFGNPVQNPQVTTKFQTVDYHGRRFQADMLRPQITVGFNDVTRRYPRFQK